MGRSALRRTAASSSETSRSTRPRNGAKPVPAEAPAASDDANPAPATAASAKSPQAKAPGRERTKRAAKPAAEAPVKATPKPVTTSPAKAAAKPAGRAKAPTGGAAATAAKEPAKTQRKAASRRASSNGSGKSATAPESETPPRVAPSPAKAVNGPKKIAEPAAARAPDEPAARPDGRDAFANPYLSPDVEAFASTMAALWQQSAAVVAAYARPREQGLKKDSGSEVAEIARTLGQVMERWMADPARVAEAQKTFASEFLELWTGTMRRLSGETVEPVIRADPRDARFKDPEWSEHPVFDFIKQAYLHASRWADRVVEETEDLDPHLRHKASFYVKLISNAASPSNFVPTNPELIRETLASKGQNLVRGMRMLAEDIERGGGDLRLRQTDPGDFEVGRNLAVTSGKVVFRNDLIELIQYSATTDMVRARPVVIVPPWINKFYVLDLNPEKSMIRWAVEQGLTVFCVSWVNPDARHAKLSFDDYMRDGIMQAVDVAREICGAEQVDAVGYCVGGTLLSVTLAYMAATGDRRISSATLMTTQVDFAQAGDLAVFVDEEQIAAVEAKMAQAGFLEGASMANAFNLIRSNDMIFPYLVNNYLKGKAPFPFDLLYWNSDATRMPAANHSFYLRGCYLNNDLAGGRMEILGETLDLKTVSIPIYELATREDHIAPAKSVFAGAQLFGGPVRFVLAGSGHIAGVVNPPAKLKYQYWTGEAPAGEFSDWMSGAEEKPGSWWPDWRAWLAAMDATMVDARVPGSGRYKALEDAPGSYVKVRS